MTGKTPRPTLPDPPGRFGDYGGRFVPETLMAALEELEREYESARSDPAFREELDGLLSDYVGRPSPLYFAANLTRELDGARIYIKREDLIHTGAHKINNAVGQALLARRLGKKRIIAETGAGQHGVAAATVCAMFGMECIVYMGEEDIRRQAPNVRRRELPAASGETVTSARRTPNDAINETSRASPSVAQPDSCRVGLAPPILVETPTPSPQPEAANGLSLLTLSSPYRAAAPFSK